MGAHICSLTKGPKSVGRVACNDPRWGPTRSRAALALPMGQVYLGGKAATSGSLILLTSREMQPLPYPSPGVPALRLFEFPIHGDISTGSWQCGVGGHPGLGIRGLRSTPSLISCVILGKLLNLSVPHLFICIVEIIILILTSQGCCEDQGK